MIQTPPFGGSGGILAPHKSALPFWVKPALVIAIAALLIILAMNLLTCSGDQITEAQPEPEASTINTSPFLETRLASFETSEDITSTDLDALPTSTDVTGFSLSTQQDAQAPIISEENRSAIASALKPFTEGEFATGFLFMDIGSGRGFSYNIDEPIYGASSFKGPFCTYVAQNFIDEGQMSLSENTDNLFNTIVYSNNLSYWKIRKQFNDEGIAGWLDSLGADSNIAYDTSYPTYTVRDSGRLWLATYDYLQEDTSAANQLRKYYSKTETSFIRKALSDPSGKVADETDTNSKGDGSGNADSMTSESDAVLIGTDTDDVSSMLASIASGEGETVIVESSDENVELGSVIVDYVSQDGDLCVETYPYGEGANIAIAETVENMGKANVKVYDKAGWYPRDENDTPAMVDAGIIECNGRAYLMCVMTEMPWSSPNRRMLEQLISSVFETRENLA